MKWEGNEMKEWRTKKEMRDDPCDKGATDFLPLCRLSHASLLKSAARFVARNLLGCRRRPHATRAVQTVPQLWTGHGAQCVLSLNKDMINPSSSTSTFTGACICLCSRDCTLFSCLLALAFVPTCGFRFFDPNTADRGEGKGDEANYRLSRRSRPKT